MAAAEDSVPAGTFPSFMAEGTLLCRRGEYGKALACFNNVRVPRRGRGRWRRRGRGGGPEVALGGGGREGPRVAVALGSRGGGWRREGGRRRRGHPRRGEVEMRPTEAGAGGELSPRAPEGHSVRGVTHGGGAEGVQLPSGVGERWERGCSTSGMERRGSCSRGNGQTAREYFFQ